MISKTHLTFSLIFFCITLGNNSLNGQTAQSPEDVVNLFFKAMAQSDTMTMSSLMSNNGNLYSSSTKDGVPQSDIGSKQRFMESVVKSAPGDLDEQISNLHTQQDDGLATVWMDYAFYYKGKFSHCGVNVFTMMKSENGWSIINLSDTRRKDNCHIKSEKDAIDAMMVSWHKAASEADSAAYFRLMTNDAIYVGTDKTEVWKKDEFLSFAAPYFAKGKAWDFTTVSRNIYSDDYKTMAWFDEIIDTWMGPCRGSGVVVKDIHGKWKIKHYVLSVTVPNDDIKEFLKIGQTE